MLDIGFRGFRHSHAGLRLNSGIDYKALQNRLGHARLSITMETYSHLSKKMPKQLLAFSIKRYKTSDLYHSGNKHGNKSISLICDMLLKVYNTKVCTYFISIYDYLSSK